MYYDKVKFNMYSQNGEDGVINVLLGELGLIPDNCWCVDVGAYDGVKYSNVRSLINRDSNAIMIEPSIVGGECEPKYSELKNLPDKFSKVVALNYMVVPDSFTEDHIKSSIDYLMDMEKKCGVDREEQLPYDTLDNILNSTKTPKDYDILNIDTDSCDHEIWQSHKEYNPKIVIIEINSSIPLDSNEDRRHGSPSFNYSVGVANQLGYSAVCHTGNMIYVRNDLVDKLSIPKTLINSVELFNKGWL